MSTLLTNADGVLYGPPSVAVSEPPGPASQEEWTA
jgi:hypothetical protein